MKAVCKRAVQIYDDGLTGQYADDQIIEGAKAQKLVERYPQYFAAVETRRTNATKKGDE